MQNQTANQMLQDRGIATEATRAGWHLGTKNRANGWQYPVIDWDGNILDQRWKALDDANRNRAGMKCAWIGTNATRPKYYVPSGKKLRPAIDAADGTLIIANGEPSVLAFMAAGYKNVLCWFGEGSIPPDLANDLIGLGVRRVLYAADKDDAGLKSAVKVRDSLQDSGIEYCPLQWPDFVPRKSDANDLWIVVGFDRDVFRHHFENLEALILPQPAPPPAPRQPRQHQPATGAIDWIHERGLWMADEVIPALDRAAPIARGKQKRHCPNPGHRDKNPSFRISTDTHTEGYPVCTCGIQDERDAWGTVAGWVGARDFMGWWRDERKPQPQPVPPPPREEEAATEDDYDYAFWPDGIPDGIRSAVLNQCESGAGLLERLNEAFITGELDPDGFTISSVEKLNDLHGWGFAASTIRRNIGHLTDVFLSKLDIVIKRTTMAKNEKNTPAAGRTAQRYALLPLNDATDTLRQRAHLQIVQDCHRADGSDYDTIAPMKWQMVDAIDLPRPYTVASQIDSADDTILEASRDQRLLTKSAHRRVTARYLAFSEGLDNPHSTPLEAAPYRNDSQYRALFLRAVIRDDIEQNGTANRSYAELCRLLGVSKGNIRALLTRSGIKNTMRHEEMPVKSAQNLAATVRIHSQTVRGRAESIVIVANNRVSEPSYPHKEPEYAAKLVSDALSQGHKVSIKYRIASQQTIIREEPLPTAQEEAAATEEAAQAAANPIKPKAAAAATEEESTHNPDKYKPRWVMDQLKLRCRLLKRPYRECATAAELVEIVTGINPYAYDPVLSVGLELGGVIEVMA